MAAPYCGRLSAVAAHVVAGGVSPHRAAAAESSLPEQPRHTGAVIGLGWMGMLYDLAQRITEVTQEMIDRGDFRQEELGRRFEMDDATRPTPTLLVHRRFQHHEHPGDSGIPSTYSEALHNRAEIDLVAAADRDTNRLAAFAERYGPAGYGGAAPRVYTDAADMLAAERPEVVAIATNTKGRAELTALAVKHGAKMILTDKPMAFSLEEADLMVRCCADAGVPLCAGSISTTHPSFERAKTLLQEGAIGELLSIEAPSPGAQHQDWSYFLDSPVSWVVGHGDLPRAESGSSEFQGYDTISTLSHASLHRNGDFTQTGLGQRAENVALTQTGLGQATQNGQSSLNVQVRLPCRQGRHHSALSQRVRTYTKRDETLPGARQWKCKKIVLIYQDIFQTAVERARSLSNLMSIDSDQNYGGGRAPQVRITGSQGEMVFDTQSQHPGWRLFQQVESFGSRSDYLTAREAAVGGMGATLPSQALTEMPWPAPQFAAPYGAVYCLDDVLRAYSDGAPEPKNSGHRVAVIDANMRVCSAFGKDYFRIALEVELAMKESSSRGGAKVELPLADRSLSLHYDWFR